MSIQRMLFAHLVIAFLVAGSAYDLITHSEHWPFASYSMYAEVQRGQRFTLGQLRGVPAEAPDQEILLHSDEHLHPFDQCRMRIGLVRMEDQPDAPRRLADALRNVLRRYEFRRELGAHRGPALLCLRYYHVEWQLDPWARNLEQPLRKKLMVEVLLD